MAPKSHRPFVAAVSAIGLALLVVFAIGGAADVVDQADGLLLLLAAAILVAELFPVEIPDGDGEVSFSTTFAFALLLTDGVAAVVIVHALALAIAEAVRRRPFERLVFNVAQYAICWTVAGGLLIALTGELPDENGLQYLELQYVPALVATAAVFLATNAALASTPPALARGTSPWLTMRGDLLLNAWWTVVLVALVPGILVAADYSLWLLPLIGIPLVAIQLGSRQAVINEHEARHDRVTGLSNREDVARVLERALHRARAPGRAGRRGDDRADALQGDQRDARAPARRPRADRGRAPAGRGGRPARRRRPPRRGRVRARARPRLRRRRLRRRRPAGARRARGTGRHPRRRARRSARTPASPATRSTAPPSTSCCATPTSRSGTRRPAATRSSSTPRTSTSTAWSG